MAEQIANLTLIKPKTTNYMLQARSRAPIEIKVKDSDLTTAKN